MTCKRYLSIEDILDLPNVSKIYVLNKADLKTLVRQGDIYKRLIKSVKNVFDISNNL